MAEPPKRHVMENQGRRWEKAHHAAVCQAKFAFKHKARAKSAASKATKRLGYRMGAFRCSRCGDYHIGSKEPLVPMMDAFRAALMQLAYGNEGV